MLPRCLRSRPWWRWGVWLLLLWGGVLAAGCSGLSRDQRARVLETAARAREDLRQFALTEADFTEQGIAADFAYPSEAQWADDAQLQRVRLAAGTLPAEECARVETAIRERQQAYALLQKIYAAKADECRRRYGAEMGTILAVIATGDAQAEVRVVGVAAPVAGARPELVLELVGRPGRFDPPAWRGRLSENWRTIWARHGVAQMNRFGPVASVPAALRESETAVAEFTRVLDLAVAETRW